jgi:hypothetical protein
MTGGGIDYQGLKNQTTSGINWTGMAVLSTATAGINWTGISELSSSQTNWSEIKLLGGKVTTISDIETTTATILRTVTSLQQAVGPAGGLTLVDKMQEIENLVIKVQELSVSIAKDSSDASKKAEELINKLVTLANEQAKELGFVGEEVKKLSASDAANIPLVQGKLEEINAYLLAIKEATGANTREASNQAKTPPPAIVKSWMELGEEQK